MGGTDDNGGHGSPQSRSHGLRDVVIAVVAGSGFVRDEGRSRHATAAASDCVLGNGKQARGHRTGSAGVDMLIPGVYFTTIGKVAKAYFDCVNDNAGSRSPIKNIPPDQQLNPAQEAVLAEADRERQGRRRRRQHELRRVRRELGSTRSQGLRRHRRRRPGRGVGYSAIAESNMGPRYSDIGRHRPDPRGREEERHRIPRGDLGVCGRRRGQAGAAKGVAVKVFDTPAGHGRFVAAAPDVPVRRRRQRHRHRLHARHVDGLHEGRDHMGSRQQDQVGLVDPIANTFMAGQSRSSTGTVDQQRVRPADASQGPTPG